MKICAISDLHIKNKSDQGYLTLIKFLNYCCDDNVTHIALLGDIFDLMVGEHKEYIDEFKEVFQKIEILLKKEKKVIYLEGNHDFNLGCLLHKHALNNNKNFIFSKKSTHIELNGKKIKLCHGDDIEIGNFKYKFYTKIIRSNLIETLSKKVPYRIVKKIGDYLSNSSREYGSSKNYNESAIRNKFRISAQLDFEKDKFDFLIFGHSHVKDNFDLKGGQKIINNGYARTTLCGTYIDNTGCNFIEFA